MPSGSLFRRTGPELPRRLLRRGVNGEVVVRLRLDREGEVLDARIDSSTLPAFDDLVLDAVSGWHFTSPTRHGVPVEAEARLPIPIQVR